MNCMNNFFYYKIYQLRCVNKSLPRFLFTIPTAPRRGFAAHISDVSKFQPKSSALHRLCQSPVIGRAARPSVDHASDAIRCFF